MSFLQSASNNPFGDVKETNNFDDNAIPVKKSSTTWTAYNVARLVLGFSIGCLAIGIIIVYFPMASHIFFTVLGAAAAISIAYLIYHACKNRHANAQATIQKVLLVQQEK